MWLGDQWRAWTARRAERFLARHPNLGLEVLRQDTALASQAFEAWAAAQEAQGKDGPHRTSFVWPSYSSLGYGGRGPLVTTLPKPTPYNVRRFSEYPPSRRACNVLENPILQLPFTVGLRRPRGVPSSQIQEEPTADQQRRIQGFLTMLERPNNDQDGDEFLEMLLEDLIVLGAGPFEVAENTSDERPLFLWPVDAQSIRINARWEEDSDTFRYSQGKGFLFGSVGIRDDVTFREGQLCYPRLNARTSSPFGYGYLEVAFDAVNAFLGAFSFATRRASNDIPPFGIFLGENVTPEQVQRFRHYWMNEVEGGGKIPILGGGRQPSAFSFTAGTARDPLWVMWQEWLVRVIAMAFGVSPMRLGLERDINKSTAQQGATDDWATVAPVANVVKNAYTHWLLWKRLGWTDLEFQWQVKSADELRQAQILAVQYEMNAITVDEIRQVYERPPLPDGLGDMTKTPYEAAIQAATTPPPADQGLSEEEAPEETPQRRPRVAAMSPFSDVDPDLMSPSAQAFMHALREVAG